MCLQIRGMWIPTHRTSCQKGDTRVSYRLTDKSGSSEFYGGVTLNSKFQILAMYTIRVVLSRYLRTFRPISTSSVEFRRKKMMKKERFEFLYLMSLYLRQKLTNRRRRPYFDSNNFLSRGIQSNSTPRRHRSFQSLLQKYSSTPSRMQTRRTLTMGGDGGRYIVSEI